MDHRPFGGQPPPAPSTAPGRQLSRSGSCATASRAANARDVARRRGARDRRRSAARRRRRPARRPPGPPARCRPGAGPRRAPRCTPGRSPASAPSRPRSRSGCVVPIRATAGRRSLSHRRLPSPSVYRSLGAPGARRRRGYSRSWTQTALARAQPDVSRPRRWARASSSRRRPPSRPISSRSSRASSSTSCERSRARRSSTAPSSASSPLRRRQAGHAPALKPGRRRRARARARMRGPA